MANNNAARRTGIIKTDNSKVITLNNPLINDNESNKYTELKIITHDDAVINVNWFTHKVIKQS